MKIAKTCLSVLLALLMLLSLPTVAFAEGDAPVYHWTPIPTSPEGLTKGQCYLDFEEIAPLVLSDLGDETQADVPGLIAMWTAGEYEVDYDAKVLRGSFLAPANYLQNPEETLITVEPSAGNFIAAVKEVGVDWQPIALSTDGLQNGDWYLDVDACYDWWVAQGETWSKERWLEELSRVSYFINPGGTMYRYKWTGVFEEVDAQGNPYTETDEQIVPLYENCDSDLIGFHTYMELFVKQYVAPDSPEEPQTPTTPAQPDNPQPDNPTGFQRLLNLFRTFFENVADFLRRLFR